MRSRSKSDSLTALIKLVRCVFIGFGSILASIYAMGLGGFAAVATAGVVVAILLWLCSQVVYRLSS